jgi:hypothetical protein
MEKAAGQHKPMPAAIITTIMLRINTFIIG